MNSPVLSCLLAKLTLFSSRAIVLGKLSWQELKEIGASRLSQPFPLALSKAHLKKFLPLE